MPSLARLTTEHAERPLGIGASPRFGWNVVLDAADGTGVRQLAWRLTVLGTEGVVWRGTGSDARCAEVAYDGDPLRPLDRYEWHLEVDTTAGSCAAASWFVTGPTDDCWHDAAWIGGVGTVPAPLLRTEFELAAQPTLALLVVAAGGLARVELDGEHAGPTHLSPGFTDYDVRVQYTVTDVTSRLSPGRHALGVELGRGFYGMTAASTWDWHTAPWHGEPSARVLLFVRQPGGDTETFTTGTHWRATEGPTRFDDYHAGEDYDARAEQPGWSRPGFDDSGWAAARAVRGPRGRLERQRQQPVTVAETLRPEQTRQVADGVWVASFPRVLAGWVQIETAGEAGETVELRFGERLTAAGLPNADDKMGYFDGRFQTDRVTLAGGRLRWEQRFGYKGFQHVEIRAQRRPDAVLARLAHTATAPTGGFVCSDPLLTRLHELTVATVLNNLHGLPTDTPKYEKNGWTGDGMLGAELMLLNLDAHELLAKWSMDIADTRHGAGAPAVIAPYGGWHLDWTPAPTWHSALLLVPWEVYRQRGDVRVLVDTWPDASAYLRFELDRWPDGVADTTLGDWVSPETDAGGGNAPEDTRVAATAFLVAMCDAAARTAEVLDQPTTPWRAAAARSREAFTRAFYDPTTAEVRGTGDVGYRQAHTVLALAFDLLPHAERQRAADRLARDVRDRGDHLSTGALATKYLLPVLTRWGHTDVAWAVATQTTFPSWGFWVERGATSLWEHWKEESRSRGHYFLGTVDDWLYSAVAGLAPLAPGWTRAAIAPSFTTHLDWAAAHLSTPQGLLAVRWERDQDGLTLEARVPVGTTADVSVARERLELGSGRHRLRFPAAR